MSGRLTLAAIAAICQFRDTTFPIGGAGKIIRETEGFLLPLSKPLRNGFPDEGVWNGPTHP